MSSGRPACGCSPPRPSVALEGVLRAGNGRLSQVEQLKERMHMTFNPLQERGIPLDKQLRNWQELNVSRSIRTTPTRTPAAASSR